VGCSTFTELYRRLAPGVKQLSPQASVRNCGADDAEQTGVAVWAEALALCYVQWLPAVSLAGNGRKREAFATLRLNPHPSHETRARRMGHPEIQPLRLDDVEGCTTRPERQEQRQTQEPINFNVNYRSGIIALRYA
jgi:hypothetical protein